MELPSSRYQSQNSRETPSASESSAMATLTMRAPGNMLPSPRDASWEDRSSAAMPTRPRSRNERIELPSIRQAIPELEQRSSQAEQGRRDTREYSPTHGRGSLDSAYVSSPALMNKRRRLSSEEEGGDSREFSTPRIYQSPRQSTRPTEPAYSPPRRYGQHPAEYSQRASPYTSSGALPSMRSSEDSRESEKGFRFNLPYMPPLLPHEREVGQHPPPRGRNWSDYALDTARPSAQTYPQPSSSAYDAPSSRSAYPSPTYDYGYQQGRGQSYSAPGNMHHPMDRSPFSGMAYRHNGPMYPGMPMPMGMGGMSDVGKHRKRRGNLPKETTDKLRAWFVAHLQHPYPTEDEKQDLMRQTGLQMNQISNWFINARRRQLPTMINNARVESDARSSLSTADGAVSNAAMIGADDQSGSEGGYDEDYEGLGSRSAGSTAAAPITTPDPMSVAAMTSGHRS